MHLVIFINTIFQANVSKKGNEIVDQLNLLEDFLKNKKKESSVNIME